MTKPPRTDPIDDEDPIVGRSIEYALRGGGNYSGRSNSLKLLIKRSNGALFLFDNGKELVANIILL